MWANTMAELDANLAEIERLIGLWGKMVGGAK